MVHDLSKDSLLQYILSWTSYTMLSSKRLIHWLLGWLGSCLSTGERQSTYCTTRFLDSQY